MRRLALERRETVAAGSFLARNKRAVADDVRDLRASGGWGVIPEAVAAYDKSAVFSQSKYIHASSPTCGTSPENSSRCA
jgi:hypothetical protein